MYIVALQILVRFDLNIICFDHLISTSALVLLNIVLKSPYGHYEKFIMF